jgi:hypothetical protein
MDAIDPRRDLRPKGRKIEDADGLSFSWAALEPIVSLLFSKSCMSDLVKGWASSGRVGGRM